MSLSNKTVLVTGSTDGVGRHVALKLGRQRAQVLVHGRDRQRGEAVVGEIRSAGGAATFYRADFSSLDDVRELAAAVGKDHGRPGLLINNAGIGTRSGGPQRRTCADGHVASAGQMPIDFDDAMLTRNYDGTQAYCQSKLAQVMFTIDLAGELGRSKHHCELPPPGNLHGHDHGARSRCFAGKILSRKAPRRS